jgi:uncharacterized membrane protein
MDVIDYLSTGLFSDFSQTFMHDGSALSNFCFEVKMLLLISGLVVFLGVHSVRMLVPGWRTRMLQTRGEGSWKALYSLVSLLGFALLCWGYGQARQQPVVLWIPFAGSRHLAALLMLGSWLLLVAAYVPGNGIKSRLHHPMLLGVKLWATAHLLANGNLADLLLFGSFLAWAVMCFISAQRRDRLAGTVYPSGRIGATLLTVAVGVLAWAGFAMFLHRALIGVPVFG